MDYIAKCIFDYDGKTYRPGDRIENVPRPAGQRMQAIFCAAPVVPTEKTDAVSGSVRSTPIPLSYDEKEEAVKYHDNRRTKRTEKLSKD